MTTTMFPLEASETLVIEERKLYHFGLLQAAPVDHISVGGQSWSKETYIPAREKGAQHLRRPGAVGHFTEAEARVLTQAMKTRVVRWTKDRTKDGVTTRYGRVYDTRSEHYHVHPGDEPLARFAYLALAAQDPAQPVPQQAVEGNLLTEPRGAESPKLKKG